LTIITTKQLLGLPSDIDIVECIRCGLKIPIEEYIGEMDGSGKMICMDCIDEELTKPDIVIEPK
jgi:hypothetical protein